MKKLLCIVLACAMICSIFVMPVSVSAAVGNRVNFPIGVATGANSELFIQYYSNSNDDNVYRNEIPADGEWVPGLDYNTSMKNEGTSTKPVYNPTGFFATDNANILQMSSVDRAGAFIYAIDDKPTLSATFVPVFNKKEDESIVWKLNDVEYGVNPTDKAIQIMTGVNAENVNDPALKARFETLAGVTLDVPNGNYSSIGFLVGDGSTVTHKLKVTPVYADGSKGDAILSDNTFKGYTNLATVYQGNFKGAIADTKTGRWANLSTQFKEMPIEGINSDKVLDKVIVESTGGHYPMVIVSAWGIGNKAAEEPAATFAVTEAKVESGSVKVAYTNTTAEAKAVKVIVAEYNDAEESSLADVHIIDATLTVGGAEFTQSVTTTKSTVKVFVWKNLTDFFPYK